jgi:phosphohistidine phosphatase
MTDRSLVILRHAKAEHPRGGRGDIDRPLSPQGHADAAAAGAWLLNKRLIPDLVLCSPAKRTRQTWHAVATALGADVSAATTRYESRLYDGGLGELLDLIKPTPPEALAVLVIGHNPLLSMLSEMLDPVGGSGGGLRTAGLAVHQAPAPWPEWAPGSAPRTHEHTARA